MEEARAPMDGGQEKSTRSQGTVEEKVWPAQGKGLTRKRPL